MSPSPPLLVLLFGLALLGPACSSEPEAPTPRVVQVRDAAGRPYTLEQVPDRIVGIGRGVYMVLHLLCTFPEGCERLVGLEGRGSGSTQFLKHVHPDLAATESLGREPNAESVLALEPDLVLIKGSTPDPRADLLGSLGIPTLHLGLETPERFLQDVALLGQVLRDPERAQAVSRHYQSRLERIRARVGELSESQRPETLVLGYSSRGAEIALKVPARRWMQTIQVEMAGGIPAWLQGVSLSDGWTVVNLEQVAAWDPEHIILAVHRSLDAGEVMASLRADPQWSLLRAVKNDHLHCYPSDMHDWNSPDPRWLLGLSWMAHALHPDRFPEYDVRQEVLAFYGTLYGMSDQEVERVVLPLVVSDAG